MFGKKLLNLVALLFAGSAVIANDCKYGGVTINDCADKKYLIISTNDAYVDGFDVMVDGCTHTSKCTLVMGDASGGPIDKANTTGYILYGEDDILSCEDGVCEHLPNATGYYINADTGNTVIKCNAGECETASKDSGTTCTAMGRFIEDVDKIYICVSETKKFELVADAAVNYSYLNVAQGESDPFTGDENLSQEPIEVLIKSINGAAETVDKPGDSNQYMVYNVDNALGYEGKTVAVTFNGSVAVNEITGENICVDETGIIYDDRKTALCTATTDCGYYYDCAGSDGCTKTEKNVRSQPGPDPTQCSPASPDENCVDGYYVGNDDDDGNTLVVTNGKLWHCDSGSCNKLENQIGYFTNKATDQFTLCVVNSGQKCTDVASIAFATCEKVGDIVTSTESGADYRLCISEDFGDTIPLSSYDGKQFMLNIDKTNGIYGIKPNTIASDEDTQFSLVVEIDGKNVKVVKEEKPIRYRYARVSDRLLYTRAQAQDGTDICGHGIDNNYEYKLDQWTNGIDDNVNADIYVEGTNTNV